MTDPFLWVTDADARLADVDARLAELDVQLVRDTGKHDAGRMVRHSKDPEHVARHLSLTTFGPQDGDDAPADKHRGRARRRWRRWV